MFFYKQKYCTTHLKNFDSDFNAHKKGMVKNLQLKKYYSVIQKFYYEETNKNKFFNKLFMN